MSDEKYREFWIEKFNGRKPASYYAFLDKPNFNKLTLKVDDIELPASEYFHVIEYSALLEERAKSARLLDALNKIEQYRKSVSGE